MELEAIISLLSLVALEMVLGIDNVIFISILAGKLPEDKQKKARQLGMLLAGVLRLCLLLLISIIIKLDQTLFSVIGNDLSGKDLILIAGGLFLMYKSTKEIYHKIEGEKGDVSISFKATSFGRVIVQILIMDLVFSIDSIVTAIGMVREIWVMFVAVIVTVGVMIFAAEYISKFVSRNPALKMLALSFLLLIGVSLIGEGFDSGIPKGYIYFAMAFALGVDILQMRMKGGKSSTVVLHEHYTDDEHQVPKKIL